MKLYKGVVYAMASLVYAIYIQLVYANGMQKH